MGVGNSFPSPGETVTISIDGFTQPATITGNSGAFSASFDTTAIPASPVPYAITYSYAGDSNLRNRSDSSTSLTVNQGSEEHDDVSYIFASLIAIVADSVRYPCNYYGGGRSSGRYSNRVGAVLHRWGNIRSACSTCAGHRLWYMSAKRSMRHQRSYYRGHGPARHQRYLHSYRQFRANLGALAGGLTISGASVIPTVTVNNKVYDGTTTATLATCTLANVLPADVLNVTCSASGPITFSDRNVGTGKTVSVTGIILGGSAAGNYTLSTTTASALAEYHYPRNHRNRGDEYKAVRWDAVGTATPTITLGSLGTGDALNFTEAYSNKNAGTGKTLIPAGSVSDGKMAATTMR